MGKEELSFANEYLKSNAMNPAMINEMYIACPEICADKPRIENIPALIIPPIPIETADQRPIDFFIITNFHDEIKIIYSLIF